MVYLQVVSALWAHLLLHRALTVNTVPPRALPYPPVNVKRASFVTVRPSERILWSVRKDTSVLTELQYKKHAVLEPTLVRLKIQPQNVVYCQKK